MKIHTPGAATAAPAIAVPGWGCGDTRQDTEPDTRELTSTRDPKASEAPKHASRGTERANEHFAMVLRRGKPTEGATVKSSLSIVSMNTAGTDLRLKPAKDGICETEADLSMGRDWHAMVTVEQKGQTGEAVYDFVARH